MPAADDKRRSACRWRRSRRRPPTRAGVCRRTRMDWSCRTSNRTAAPPTRASSPATSSQEVNRQPASADVDDLARRGSQVSSDRPAADAGAAAGAGTCIVTVQAVVDAYEDARQDSSRTQRCDGCAYCLGLCVSALYVCALISAPLCRPRYNPPMDLRDLQHPARLSLLGARPGARRGRALTPDSSRAISAAASSRCATRWRTRIPPSGRGIRGGRARRRRRMLPSDRFPDVKSLRAAWTEHEAKMRAFVGGPRREGVNRVHRVQAAQRTAGVIGRSGRCCSTS